MSVVIDRLVPSFAADLSDAAVADHYGVGVGTPWLRVNFVSSVDGAATIDGKSGGLGTDSDAIVFDVLRRLCDVVLVAAGTVRTEGYGAMVVDQESVDARVKAGLAPQPTFAIVSAKLDLDPAAEMFTKAPVRPIVFTVESAVANPALSEVADVIVCGTDMVEPAAMVAALVERGLTRIHCEGGPSLFGSLLEADAVDELCLTISPTLVGGMSGRIVKSEKATPRGMTLAGVLRSDDTLLLRYTRER